MRKMWKKIIAVFLIAVMLSTGPLADAAPKNGQGTTEQATPEGISETDENEQEQTADSSVTGEKKYISELRLFKKSEINNKAVTEGWTIVKNGDSRIDLNEFTGKEGVYLGYKTSTNEAEAIRDIKMLEMDHGYEWFDYQKVAEGEMAKLEPMAADIATAAVEFKENLEKGSKAAEEARKFLNLLYFTRDYPDSSKKESGERILLGDYLASGNVDQQMLKKLIVRMNGGSLLAIYTQLALGVTDTEMNWAERISGQTTFTTTNPTTAQCKLWDGAYYEYAQELLPKLQSFAKGYNSIGQGAATGAAAELEVSGEEELTSQNIQTVMDAGNSEGGKDIVYETAYGMMNRYEVNGEGVGDYILRLASGSYNVKRDYRDLYPLVQALTNAQYAMCRMLGIEQLAIYLDCSDEAYANMDAQRDKIITNIERVTGGQKVFSVWAGVNTEFYDRPVALTSDAYREKKASADYTELTREGEFYDTMNLVMMGIGIASSTCAVITGSITLGLLISGSSLTVWAACVGIIGTGFWATVGGIIGCAAVIGGTVFLIAMIVAMIIYGVYKLAEYVHRDDKGDYTEMPKEIYDIVETKTKKEKKRVFTKYVPVTNAKGEPQDINGDDGNRWNLLYYTKNSNYGAPLCEDREGNAFARVTDMPSTPKGTVPIACFGEEHAANLNSYVRQSKTTPIYLYYITSDSLENTNGSADIDAEEEVNQGEMAKGDKEDNINKNKYLYSLIVSKEGTESAAKAAIKKKPGYKVFDKNLTPGTETFTYIGYALTSVEKDAIRDIRIAPNYSQDLVYGSAPYASAGTFEDGSALIYTRHKDMGSPVLGGLAFRDEILPAEDPLEPINMLSGGNAFNLNLQRGGKPIYLYFLPSETYTSGEKYISGIQIVAGRKTKKTRDRDALMKELGLNDYGLELASYPVMADEEMYVRNTATAAGQANLGVHEYENYTAHLAYSTTYNPYRAIYDIGIYRATTRIDTLQPMLSIKSGGVYVNADVIMISDDAELGFDVEPAVDKVTGYSLDVEGTGKITAGYEEMIRVLKSRSWINPPHSRNRDFKQSLNPEGNINYTFGSKLAVVNTNYRLLGLYMVGRRTEAGKPTKAPLKVEDVVVTSVDRAPDGMRPVPLFMDPYSDTPTNLGFETDAVAGTPVYMYMRGSVPEKPQYISSIEVATYRKPEPPKKVDDMESDEKKQYEMQVKYSDNYSDDSCRMELIGKVSGEIYNYNISPDQSTVWYRTERPTSNTATYLGVNRTNNANQAITGVLLYRADKRPEPEIKVNGIRYKRAGDTPIAGLDQGTSYYLYYTVSPAAGTGGPLTELSFDSTLIRKGEPTAFTITKPDSDDSGTGAEYQTGARDIGLKIHMSVDASESVVCGIVVLTGKRYQVASEMMSRGYYYFIDADLNYNTGCREVYLGYKMCKLSDYEEAVNVGAASDSDFDDDDDDDFSDFRMDFDDIDVDTDVSTDEGVIRDVVITRGGTGDKEIAHNGTTYKRVSDVSLNEGTDGTKLYVYAAYGDTFTIGGVQTRLSPLSGLSVCSHDAVPGMGDMTNKYGYWEDILTTDDEIVNLNDGVISTDYVGHIKDCRLFMFAHRYDASIKPGAQIDRGMDAGGEILTANDSEMVGDIKLAG